MIFSDDTKFLKEIKKWYNLSEEEQIEKAEKNDWFWYFEWYDEGNKLWTSYKKADKSKNCSKKFNAYDGWDKKRIIKSSNIFLGLDGKFYETPEPIRTWETYQPCENKNCKYYEYDKRIDRGNCKYFGCNERMYDCFGGMCSTLQMVKDLCGNKGLDEIKKKYNIHKDIIEWFKDKKYFENEKDDKMNEALNNYKELLLENGRLCYQVDAGQSGKEIYEYSGFIEYIQKLCKKYDIEFNKKDIDKEWYNYVQTKSYEIEKKLENILFKQKSTQTKWITPKNIKEYLEQSSIITEKCYYLLGTLRKNEISYKRKILVGYIDWFGDYKENERKIYCHIDTDKNQIYFKENRKATKSAFLHDIAFQYLITDLHRIQHDIEIKLTQDLIDNEVKNKIGEYTGEDWGYIHCHMGQTIGSYK